MTDPGGSKFKALQEPLGNTEWRKLGESLCPLIGNKWLLSLSQLWPRTIACITRYSGLLKRSWKSRFLCKTSSVFYIGNDFFQCHDVKNIQSRLGAECGLYVTSLGLLVYGRVFLQKRPPYSFLIDDLNWKCSPFPQQDPLNECYLKETRNKLHACLVPGVR